MINLYVQEVVLTYNLIRKAARASLPRRLSRIGIVNDNWLALACNWFSPGCILFSRLNYFRSQWYYWNTNVIASSLWLTLKRVVVRTCFAFYLTTWWFWPQRWQQEVCSNYCILTDSSQWNITKALIASSNWTPNWVLLADSGLATIHTC